MTTSFPVGAREGAAKLCDCNSDERCFNDWAQQSGSIHRLDKRDRGQTIRLSLRLRSEPTFQLSCEILQLRHPREPTGGDGSSGIEVRMPGSRFGRRGLLFCGVTQEATPGSYRRIDKYIHLGRKATNARAQTHATTSRQIHTGVYIPALHAEADPTEDTSHKTHRDEVKLPGAGNQCPPKRIFKLAMTTSLSSSMVHTYEMTGHTDRMHKSSNCPVWPRGCTYIMYNWEESFGGYVRRV